MNETLSNSYSQSPKLTRKVKTGWIVAVALFLIIMVIPASGLFTAQIKLSIAITAAVMCGFAFEILPNVVLGIMLLTAYIVLGLAPAGTALSGFTNENVWATASAMLLVGCMDQTRVLKKACYGCMKNLGGSYRAIVIAMTIVSIPLGAVIGGANLTGPMIILAYALCVALGVEPGSNEAALVMISSYVAANGPCSYFFSSLQAMGVSAVQTTVPDMAPITFTDFFYHNWPMIIFGFLSIAVCILVFPLGKKHQTSQEKHEQKAVANQYLTQQLNSLGRMQTKDYVMVGILLLVFVGLLTMNFTHLSIAWILMLGAIVCFLPFIKIGNEAAVKTIKWPVFIFMGATMGIGAVFSAVGVNQFLGSLIAPLLVNAGETLCMFFVWLFACVANFFLTPLASINTLLPAVVEITHELGIPELPVLYTFLQGATNTCVLPYEIAMPLFMFSYGMCSLKQFVKAMGLITVLNGIFVVAVMVPYWNLIGLL